MEIARKMTLASINNLRKGLKDVKSSFFVARFFGIAAEAVPESDGGGSVQWKFLGEFQGVNSEGREHGAPVLYLPHAVANHLADLIRGANSLPVKFAYDLFAEPDSSAILGHTIKALPLIEPSKVDTLADVKSQLPAVPLPQGSLVPAGTPSPTPEGDKGTAETPVPVHPTKPAAKSTPKK